MALIDETGNTYGRLKVIEYYDKKHGTEHTPRPGAYWLCECSCGKKLLVSARSMRTGNTRSCGCSRRKKRRADNGEE